jgi:hypothetical protein
VQAYSERLTQILPPVRHDQRRSVESVDLPLERAPAVCSCIITAAYVKDNIPLLQRFIIDRCISDSPANKSSSSSGNHNAGRPSSSPEPPNHGSHHHPKRMSDMERSEEEVRWERVTLDPAIRALETLESAALKVLDVGLMTQLTKYIDGPLLPGPGIQVMAANLAAWRLEQVLTSSIIKGFAHCTLLWLFMYARSYNAHGYSLRQQTQLCPCRVRREACC